MKYHRSTCKCTDASPSYVSRISVGTHSRVFPFTRYGSLKRRHRGWDRGAGSLVKIARRVLIGAIYLSHNRATSSRGTPILITNLRKSQLSDLMGTLFRGISGIRCTLCSHCCANLSLIEINLRPGGDSQSYRFVWQLFERREKDDGIITADHQIWYIVPHTILYCRIYTDITI